jgi:endonuclease YncB( thermonuclease family)
VTIQKIIAILILTTSTAFTSNLNAKPKRYGTITVTEITSIYDADTFRANIAGWPDIVGHHVSIRVNGVDAPEIRGKCESEKIGARIAKKVTVELLRNAKVIELRNIKRGKYFRIIADVYVDGQSLADILIKKKLAVPYEGGKRQSWC